MNTPIPYGKQHISDSDIQAVVDVLKSDYLTQGPRIEMFEEAFANYIGSDYAVAVSNGTAALHCCALALNVKNDTKVITTPITFSASANCIHYCGGQIDFVDIDPNTYLMDLDRLKKKLEAAPKNSYSGIIPVDFAGRAVDMETLREIASDFGLWILEDACHAPGGYFVDQMDQKQLCGSGKFADLSIFSFHPVKHIATGEGGMITTNNEEFYKRLLHFRTHGITKNSDKFTQSVSQAYGHQYVKKKESEDEEYPGWYMEMQNLGYNYRLTDFQAALGISQLSRAEEGLKKRQRIAEKYYEAFAKCDFIQGQSGVVDGHAYHLYIIEVDDRAGLYEHLRKNKIYSQIHYVPVHLMPYYRQLGWKEGDFPHAEQYYSRCLSLPMYPTLTNEELEFVIDCVCSYYE